jgi:hypothetical protein
MTSKAVRPSPAPGGPVTIASQGSFAVGGTVVSTGGGFDPRNPVDPAGQTNEQWFFNQFRLGLWPDLYEGGQFSSDPAAREQFFRGLVPDTGPLDTEVIVAAASAAIDRIGPLVLVTHSHAGGFGWLTQLRNRNVRAVVSIACARPSS